MANICTFFLSLFWMFVLGTFLRFSRFCFPCGFCFFFLEFCLASHFVPFCTSYFCRVIISLLAFDQKYLLDKFCKLGNRRQKEGKQKDFVSLWRKISYEREREKKKKTTHWKTITQSEWVCNETTIHNIHESLLSHIANDESCIKRVCNDYL